MSDLPLLPLSEHTELEYTNFNTSGVEKEVGELLYAFTRILKPNAVLETGTAKGISSAYIGKALKDNNKGMLDTIEFDQQHWADARKLWKDISVDTYIQLHEERVENFRPQKEYDMMFLDSEPPLRFNELVRFCPLLKKGGYIFIHDLPYTMAQGNVNPDHIDFPNWPYGNMPNEMINWIKNGNLRPFFFPNPRGLGGFYKPKEDEEAWKKIC